MSDNSQDEVDRLLDIADIGQSVYQDRLSRINHPVIRSYKEFLDKEGNIKDRSPYYVVVHADQIKNDREIDEDTRNRLLSEISFIEKNFDHTRAGPFIIAAVPGDRPIIVCGAYDGICVGEQHSLLIRAGYDAYVSKEGTLPFMPDTLKQGS